MADVFLSYARDEQARADEVRAGLEKLGLSVFHDVERLDGGDEWSDVIDAELKAAGCVVGLWSPHSLSRPWVKRECAFGQDQKKLVPVLIESVSDMDLPVRFSGLQQVDLTDYHGQSGHDGWRRLVRSLAKVLKRKDLLAAQIEKLKDEKQTANTREELAAAKRELEKLRKANGGVRPKWLAGGLLLILSIVAFAAWWGPGELDRRVETAAAEARLEMAEAVRELDSVSDEQLESGEVHIVLDSIIDRVGAERLSDLADASADAALLLGWAHELGRTRGDGSSPKDGALAAEYYKKACSQGSARGCLNLARAHHARLARGRDMSLATDLYEAACTQAYQDACVSLARVLAEGDGVAKDIARAKSILTDTCDDGVALACFEMGLVVEAEFQQANQLRLPGNSASVAALDWYRKACSLGSIEACERRPILRMGQPSASHATEEPR